MCEYNHTVEDSLRGHPSCYQQGMLKLTNSDIYQNNQGLLSHSHLVNLHQTSRRKVTVTQPCYLMNNISLHCRERSLNSREQSQRGNTEAQLFRKSKKERESQVSNIWTDNDKHSCDCQICTACQSAWITSFRSETHSRPPPVPDKNLMKLLKVLQQHKKPNLQRPPANQSLHLTNLLHCLKNLCSQRSSACQPQHLICPL